MIDVYNDIYLKRYVDDPFLKDNEASILLNLMN